MTHLKQYPQSQPTITTDRLILRPFTAEDAATVQRLAGDKVIADTTERIPYPYEDGMAEKWIAGLPEKFRNREECTFAVVAKDTGELLGGAGINLEMQHYKGEIGYWIGKEYWGRGYCTEAAHAVMNFGFTVLGLHRICGMCMSRNPASGRVLKKLGMKYEGTLREHACKWGVFEDMEVYGMLYEEWGGTERDAEHSTPK